MGRGVGRGDGDGFERRACSGSNPFLFGGFFGGVVAERFQVTCAANQYFGMREDELAEIVNACLDELCCPQETNPRQDIFFHTPSFVCGMCKVLSFPLSPYHTFFLNTI